MLMDSRPLNRVEYRNRKIVLIGLIVLFLLPYFYNPFVSGIASCAFKELSGYPCPTCGLSRSIYLTAHLSISDALKYHIMGPVLYAGLAALFLIFLLEFLAGKMLSLKKYKFLPYLALYAIGAVWFIYWLLMLGSLI